MPPRPVAKIPRHAAKPFLHPPAVSVHPVSHPPAWAACLTAFERELTPQQFATWIRPLSCADESGHLRLTAPNRFVLQWVKDRFGGRIETLARQATGASVAVEFAVADAAATRHAKAANEPAPAQVKPVPAAPVPSTSNGLAAASTPAPAAAVATPLGTNPA